jgi:hypothetical protein
MSQCVYFKEGTFYLAQLISKLHKTGRKAKGEQVLSYVSI